MIWLKLLQSWGFLLAADAQKCEKEKNKIEEAFLN